MKIARDVMLERESRELWMFVKSRIAGGKHVNSRLTLMRLIADSGERTARYYELIPQRSRFY